MSHEKDFSVRKYRIKSDKVFFTVLLLIALVVWSYPVILTVITSLKTDSEVIQNPIGLPKQISFKAFVDSWNLLDMGHLILNSLLYSLAGSLLALLFSFVPAFALSRVRIPGGNIIFIILLTGLMIPQQTVIIPLYEVLSKIKLLNNPFGLILVHGVYGIPFVLLILRGYIVSIPKELEAAAQVDGCNDIKLLFHIILPLTMQGIIVAGVLNVINIWKELFFALVFLNNEAYFPLTVGLIKVTQSQYFNSWNLPSSTVLISQIPTVIIYILAYQWIQKGMMAGAIKG